MKYMFAVAYVALVLFAGNINAQSSGILTARINATTVTPEAVLGERLVSGNLGILPGILQGETTVYLLCHGLSQKLDNITSLDAAKAAGLFIYQATLINDKWNTILSHSGQKKGAIEQRYSYEFKGGERIYYRWLAIKPGLPLMLSDVASFIMPRPVNIAILGDSYGSGEGAPKNTTPLWDGGPYAENCHRSTNAGQYQGVEDFINRHGNIAIVYKPFFVTCSGAQTHEVIASHKITNMCNNPVRIQPQLKQLSDVFASRALYKEDIQGKVDMVIISISGNDAGFSDAVSDAFMGRLASSINSYTEGVKTAVPKSYNMLAEALDGKCIKYVLATEYPDPTTGKNGVVCGLPMALVNFNWNSLFETAMSSAVESVPGLCEAANAINGFFPQSGLLNYCNQQAVFPASAYGDMLNYLRCNVPQVAALSDADLAIRIANGFTAFLQAVSSSGSYTQFESVLNTCVPVNGTISNFNLFATLLATQADITAAKTGLVLPLNNTIQKSIDSIKQAGHPGWYYVGESMARSATHGICRCEANQRYYNSLASSFLQQGNYSGVMHMNAIGQENIYAITVGNVLEKVVTANERKKMYNDAQACSNIMPAQLTELPPSYTLMLRKRLDLRKELMVKTDKEFLKMKEKMLPGIQVILNKIGTKAFATQYASLFTNKKFETIRSKRLQQ